MMGKLKSGFILLWLGVMALPVNAQIMTNRRLADEMSLAMQRVQTLKYRMVKKERFNGAYKTTEIQVKYAKNPFKVYIYVYSPKPGVELLYVTGQNSGKVRVNPSNSFLNLLSPELDPYGKTLRKDEHHTLFESGFEFTRNLIDVLKKRADAEGKFDQLCQIQGEIKWAGRDCYKVLLQYPDFKWEPYVVQKGEDLVKIARKFNLNEYMILERNNLSWYDKVSAGQTIQIPNIFAKKVFLYVDKLHKLPIYQEVHDDKGLFEQYEYHSLLINPTITPEEFTPDYKDYGF